MNISIVSGTFEAGEGGRITVNIGGITRARKIYKDYQRGNECYVVYQNQRYYESDFAKAQEGAAMGKSLAEYAAQHPQPEPERERQTIAETARIYNDRQQAQETIEQIKDCIAQQVQDGTPPQYILYTALHAIGMLTNDAEWADVQQQTLDSVYADLAQQSLLVNNAATAAARLDTMQEQYNDKLRRQLKTQLAGYRRIEKALQEALQAVDALAPEQA